MRRNKKTREQDRTVEWIRIVQTGREEKNAAAFGEKIAALGRGPACMPGSMH